MCRCECYLDWTSPVQLRNTWVGNWVKTISFGSEFDLWGNSDPIYKIANSGQLFSHHYACSHNININIYLSAASQKQRRTETKIEFSVLPTAQPCKRMNHVRASKLLDVTSHCIPFILFRQCWSLLEQLCTNPVRRQSTKKNVDHELEESIRWCNLRRTLDPCLPWATYVQALHSSLHYKPHWIPCTCLDWWALKRKDDTRVEWEILCSFRFSWKEGYMSCKSTRVKCVWCHADLSLESKLYVL